MISFLPGRERSEVSEACALRYIVHPAMAVETAASANQTVSQSAKLFCCEATSEAKRAVTPIATCPQPGTAVNDDARSIASRMKRRLSIARSCSAGGSTASGFWKGWTTAMLGEKYTRGGNHVKCFTVQSKVSRANKGVHTGRVLERVNAKKETSKLK